MGVTPTPPNQQGTALPPQSSEVDLRRMVNEELDREKHYSRLAQDQMGKDREFFQFLFSRSVWFLGLLLAAAVILLTFFEIKTTSQLRTEMRNTAQTELNSVRQSVQARVEQEFRQENITALVRAVARERTQAELERIIRSEVGTQVTRAIEQQRPVIERMILTRATELVNQMEPKITALVSKEASEKAHLYNRREIEYFDVEKDQGRVIVVPGTPKVTAIYFVLKQNPIPQSVELQWHVAVQPKDSYGFHHNLMGFAWGDDPNRLKSHRFSISYVPDPRAPAAVIRGVTLKDGKGYADGKGLPLPSTCCQ